LESKKAPFGVLFFFFFLAAQYLSLWEEDQKISVVEHNEYYGE